MPVKERLQVRLHPGWVQAANPKGPVTFWRLESKNPLMVSYAFHKGGEPPGFTEKTLLGMARDVLKGQGGAEIFSEETGACPFGFYATVACKLDKLERFQLWHLSNGRDLINVTYICNEAPQAGELEEARDIALSMHFKYEKKPWWRLG